LPDVRAPGTPPAKEHTMSSTVQQHHGHRPLAPYRATAQFVLAAYDLDQAQAAHARLLAFAQTLGLLSEGGTVEQMSDADVIARSPLAQRLARALRCWPAGEDMLSVYEREDQAREERTCRGCRVEAGSRRDNDDGRRQWWQWACDDMDLMPCGVCRPAEAGAWLRKHGEHFTAETIERTAAREAASPAS
jgi:hypothetical protein